MDINGISSKAVTTIDLREPLIERPGDFMLSITKFKIDTECIPIMIPEMLQPQDLTNDYVKKQNKMQTKYQVMMDFTRKRTITTEIKDKNGNIVRQKDAKGNMVDKLVTTKTCSSQIHKEYVYVQHYKYNNTLTNETRYLGYAKNDD